MLDWTCSVAMTARSTSDFAGFGAPVMRLHPSGSCCLEPLENSLSLAPVPSGRPTRGARLVSQSVCGATAARFPSPPSKQLGSTVTELAGHDGPTTASARATVSRHAATRQVSTAMVRSVVWRALTRAAEPAVMRDLPVRGLLDRRGIWSTGEPLEVCKH